MSQQITALPHAGNFYPHRWLTAAAALTLIYLVIVGLDLWPWLRGLAPYPPEWRWLYLPIGWQRPAHTLVHLGLLALYGAAVTVLTRMGPESRGSFSHTARRRLAVATAVTFYAVWQLAQVWLREESLLDTLIFRTYAPPLNGYFVAPAQVESVRWTLHHYLESMPGFFAHKPQTHPPGLFLFYALCNGLFARLPDFSGWFAPIARSWAIPGRDWPLLVDHLVTSAFATSLLQIGLASLAPAGLYLLLRQLTRPQAEQDGADLAIWATLLLPLLPSLSLFVLQWDANYLVLGFLAWFLAVRGQDRLFAGTHGHKAWLDWLWAGLSMSLLTWLSFGTNVIGLLIGLHILWRAAIQYRRFRWRLSHLLPTGIGLAIMGMGVALPWLVAYLAWGMNYFALLRFGLSSHYTLVTAHRTYTLWWWLNLVDFLLWLGPALMLLGMAGSAALWRWARQPGSAAQDLAGMAAVFWPILLLLDLSGTTRGEIGRLWTFLMPFPLIFSLAFVGRRRQRLVLTALLLATNWTLSHVLAPLLCC